MFHVEQVQGIETLEEYQKRICDAVSKYDRVAISSCHDIGKTFTMAKLILWFTSSFKNSKCITTATTHKQVRMILWSEIRSGFKNSKYPLGGKMLQTEWKIEDDWYAVGISTKTDAQSPDSQGQGAASSFQGFHAEHILVVFDEATGINRQIWTQAEGLMTSANVKFVAIGNPTSRASQFFQCFRSPVWKKIYLSCFDSPNLKENNINCIGDLELLIDELLELSEDDRLERLSSFKVIQPQLLTLQWVVEKAIEWGIDHPLFISKVLGKFPEEDDHILITLGMVEAAQKRDLEPEESDVLVLGADIARYGSDKTVLTLMHGPKVIEKRVLMKKSTVEVTGEIINMANTSGPIKCITIDGTGIGSGVVDMLKEAKTEKRLHQRTEVREVHFGESCKDDKDKEKYVNIKAKMYSELAKDIKSDLDLLDEAIYLEELPMIMYKFDSKGRLYIESKDDYKKRTGLMSPDHADSLALANYGRSAVGRVGTFSSKMRDKNRGSGRGTMAGSHRGGDTW